MDPNFQSEGSFAYDNLLAGDFPRATKTVTLISGQNQPRGALLGKITASGKYTLSLAAAEDGSEVPCAVLGKATDASDGDLKTVVYQTGEFNEDAITYGTGHSKSTAATVDACRERSIFLKSIVPA
jgi:hypothetical protein